MLEKFRDLIKYSDSDSDAMPIHVAIVIKGVRSWAKNNNLPLETAYAQSSKVVKNIIHEQVKNKICIITFYIIQEIKEERIENLLPLLDATSEFFNSLSTDEFITGSKIRLSVLGKWYNLPGRFVDSIKKMIDATKNFDNHFVNFCVNYSGQEEIVDACKLIARQVVNSKLDIDSINKEVIKENLYSSNFPMPDLLITTGGKDKSYGLLLWDSANSRISHSSKLWPDYNDSDFIKTIRYIK